MPQSPIVYDPNATYHGGEPPERSEILLFSPIEVADNLGVTRRTVYRWMKEGTLRGIRVGGQWRIPETEIAAMVTAQGFSFNPTTWKRDGFDQIKEKVAAGVPQ